jgi:hypothetical protein
VEYGKVFRMNALNALSKNTAAFFVQAAIAFGVSDTQTTQSGKPAVSVLAL